MLFINEWWHLLSIISLRHVSNIKFNVILFILVLRTYLFINYYIKYVNITLVIKKKKKKSNYSLKLLEILYLNYEFSYYITHLYKSVNQLISYTLLSLDLSYYFATKINFVIIYFVKCTCDIII